MGPRARVLALVVLCACLVGVAGTAAGGATPSEATGNDGYEPNDDPANATNVTTGTLTATVVGEEFDYYAVSLRAGQRVRVTTTGASGEPVFELIAPDGEIVDYSYVPGTARTYTARRNGTHYVVVHDLGNETTGYELSVTTAGSVDPATVLTNDRLEPNGWSLGDAYGDGFPNARVVTPDTTYRDLRLIEREADNVAVSLGVNETLHVAATFEHSDGDIDVRVYGPQDRLRAAANSTTDDESLAYTPTRAGVHTIQVDSDDPDGGVGYDLSVTTTATGPVPVAGAVRPTDPDGDGVYEDVNGDGVFDLIDVSVLYDNRADPAVTGAGSYYDADGNGGFDLVDVAVLYEQVS